jgi:hypothetical protein
MGSGHSKDAQGLKHDSDPNLTQMQEEGDMLALDHRLVTVCQRVVDGRKCKCTTIASNQPMLWKDQAPGTVMIMFWHELI